MFTFDGKTYTLAEMLAVNQDDPACIEWLHTAKVGDQFNGCECIAATGDPLAPWAFDLKRWREELGFLKTLRAIYDRRTRSKAYSVKAATEKNAVWEGWWALKCRIEDREDGIISAGGLLCLVPQ